MLEIGAELPVIQK